MRELDTRGHALPFTTVPALASQALTHTAGVSVDSQGVSADLMPVQTLYDSPPRDEDLENEVVYHSAGEQR